MFNFKDLFGFGDKSDNKGALNAANFGLNAVKTGLGAYLSFKDLDLQNKTFKFNKRMAEKQYDMAKDAYDREVRRQNNLGRQMQKYAVSNNNNSNS